MKNTIKGWDFKESELSDAIINRRMLNPSIDLTNACNLNCPYCYIEDKNSTRKKRKPNEISLKETYKIIDDLFSLGAKTINIVGAGEPTIDSHFYDIISYINERNIVPVLFTNGIKLASDKKLVDFLYKQNVSIVLKYNSRNEKIQDVLAGKKGYTKKRNIALNNLIEKGFNKTTPTRLGLDILALNDIIDDIISIHNFCRVNNIFPIIADYIPTGRTEGGHFVGYGVIRNFNPDEIINTLEILEPASNGNKIKLLNEIENIDKQFNIKHDACVAYYSGSKCTQIIGLYIDIEGYIYPCVARKKLFNSKLLDGKLGSIKKGDSIINIWKSNEYIGNLLNNYKGCCPYKKQL